MLMERRSLIKRSVLLLLIGLSVFLFYLYFFVGMADIAVVIHRASLFYYSLAVIAVLLSMTFYSLTWQKLMSLLSIKTTFRKTFLFTWIGTFVDLLVPAEAMSGEISRAYLMSKSAGENTGKVVASIVSHRILSMAVTLSGLIISSTFLILKCELPIPVLNFITVVAIYSAVSTFLLCYLCFKEQTTWRIINWVLGLFESISRGRWQLTRLRSKAQRMLKDFHQEIGTLGRHPRGLAQPVIFSVMTWFLEVLISFLVFASISFNFSLIEIIIVYSLTVTIQAIPLGVPAEIGLTEIVMTALYTLLGVPSAISAAATVLIRVITVWFRVFIGYIAVQWIGIKALMDIRL